MRMNLVRFNQFGKNRYRPIKVIPITARLSLTRKIFEAFMLLRIDETPW